MFNLINVYPRHTVFFDRRILYLTASSFLKRDFFDKARIIEFEQAFATYVGTKEAISVSSGRVALYLILKAFQYPPGSEVILADYNFPPIVSVIIGSGLKPVFADIDVSTFNIDVRKIEERISSKTKAILVTHMFGNPCDMDAVSAIAKRYGLNVVEDGAHAFGSGWRERRVGNLGDATFFSLSQGKNIASFGGGVITTSDKVISKRVRNYLKDFPDLSLTVLLKRILKTITIYQVTKRPFFNLLVYPLLGIFNYFLWNVIEQNSNEKICLHWRLKDPRKFSSLQAGIGLYQLSRIDEYKKKKREIVEYLDGKLGKLKSITVQRTLPCAENYKLYYVVYVKNKSKNAILGIRHKLLDRGVDTQFLDMHACSVLNEFRAYACDCPNAATVAHTIFEIPSDISLNSKDLDWVIQAIDGCAK